MANIMDTLGLNNAWVQLAILGTCLILLFITTLVSVFLCSTWCAWYCCDDRKYSVQRSHRLGKANRGLPECSLTSPDDVTRRSLVGQWAKRLSSIQSYGTVEKTQPRYLADEVQVAHPFIYARIRLTFKQENRDIKMAELCSIETINCHFFAKDLYLELRNSMSNTSTPDDLKAVGFHQSILKMRKKYLLSNPVLVSTDYDCFEIDVPTDREKDADFANLFLKRDRSKNNRIYVASAKSIECRHIGYSPADENEENEEMEDSRTTEDGEASLFFELDLQLFHIKQESLGRIYVSLAYLPTAEKISVDISESFLDKKLLTKYTHLSGCYWKLTLMQKNKRHSRKRVSTVPLSYHMTWHNEMHIFDWISRDSIKSLTLVLSLIGVGKITTESDTTTSNKQDDQSQLSIDTQSSIDTESLSSIDSASKDSVRSKVLDTDTSTCKVPAQSKHEVIGEVYIGNFVPERDCCAQWNTMLLQPRHIVSRWQEIH